VNSSRISIGSTMCGIILEDDSDCNAMVSADAPLNLCPSHFRAAAAWVLRNDETRRETTICEVCGKKYGRAGKSGYSCGLCGYQSHDFVGTTYLSPAERGQEFRHLPKPKQVEVVYYIQFGDRIKIGTSRNPRSRLGSLPYDQILAFERGGTETEGRRHTQFRESRIRNTEWFEMSDALLAHAAELNEGVSDVWEQYRGWQGRR